MRRATKANRAGGSQNGHHDTVSTSAAPAAGRTLRALANSNYRLYFFGQIVSQTGGWLQRIAQAWLVLDLTGSPAALGLSGHVELWQVYFLAFILGTISAFEMPTRQAFLSELVPRDELQSAISLNSSVFNGARIIGPGIGGVIIAAWGVGWCFGLNALSFVASLISLAMLETSRLHAVRRPPRGPLWTQLADGLRYAARTPALAFPLLLLAFIGTFGYNMGVVFPLLARYALNLDAVGFGSLNTAMGVGSLIGALGVAARLSPTANALLISAGAFSVLLLSVAYI